MPLFKVVMNFSRPDEDKVQWTFGVDGPEPSNVSALSFANSFQTIWAADPELLDGIPALFTLDYCEFFPADGGPAAAVGVLAPPQGMGGLGNGRAPEEVAIRVSSHVDGVRGTVPMGGFYVGPLSSDMVNSHQPDAGFCTALREFLVDWHEWQLLAGYQPVVISRYANTVERPNAVGFEIVGYSTDNAFDTQRRRGSKPTTRTYLTA